MARTPDEADRLVWHGGCREDLANFVRQAPGRVAVVAKGGDARALVGLMQEKQIARERLHTLGVPCHGMLYLQGLERRVGFEEIVAGRETADTVVVETASGSTEIPRSEALYAGCLRCERPTPPIYDELIAEPVAPRASDCDDPAVARIEALTPEERWADFESNLATCIRCYACRNACPLCYCAACFTERATPAWLGTTPEPADAQLYHLIRALHLGGRCVDCGACNHACPQGIDLRRLNKKLEKAAREMFGHMTGVDPEALPAMATYDEKDPQDFILE
jgi:ferredoxin